MNAVIDVHIHGCLSPDRNCSLRTPRGKLKTSMLTRVSTTTAGGEAMFRYTMMMKMMRMVMGWKMWKRTTTPAGSITKETYTINTVRGTWLTPYTVQWCYLFVPFLCFACIEYVDICPSFW